VGERQAGAGYHAKIQKKKKDKKGVIELRALLVAELPGRNSKIVIIGPATTVGGQRGTRKKGKRTPMR